MTLIFFLAPVCVVVFFLLKAHTPIFNEANLVVKSPIPDYLTNTHLADRLDFWKPKEAKVLSSSIAKPEITAHAAFVYDFKKDEILFEKNSRQRLPVASLAKIATAIVALESKSSSDTIVVAPSAASVGENSMGISEGEVYTVEELLYGLVLESGNDAATALAQSVAGDTSHFVALMNQKAKILGLFDTHFVNPTGLEEDNEHEYSSALDLAILTKHALGIAAFAKAAATYEYHIAYSSEHKELWLYNQTNLLTSYPGVKGVKTGYTPSAGLCLVTYAENGGEKVIGVLLDSQDRRGDMKKLLDYSFAVLGVRVQ